MSLWRAIVYAASIQSAAQLARSSGMSSSQCRFDRFQSQPGHLIFTQQPFRVASTRPSYNGSKALKNNSISQINLVQWKYLFFSRPFFTFYLYDFGIFFQEIYVFFKEKYLF